MPATAAKARRHVNAPDETAMRLYLVRRGGFQPASVGAICGACNAKLKAKARLVHRSGGRCDRCVPLDLTHYMDAEEYLNSQMKRLTDRHPLMNHHLAGRLRGSTPLEILLANYSDLPTAWGDVEVIHGGLAPAFPEPSWRARVATPHERYQQGLSVFPVYIKWLGSDSDDDERTEDPEDTAP